jgi:hypothetical protein
MSSSPEYAVDGNAIWTVITAVAPEDPLDQLKGVLVESKSNPDVPMYTLPDEQGSENPKKGAQ